MVALRVGEMPMSLQNATRWPCGTDIGTQARDAEQRLHDVDEARCAGLRRDFAAVRCGRCNGTTAAAPVSAASGGRS
jgi:hypothetical protein